MINREQTKDLITSSKYFPVIAILGPRQSGKTTLAKSVFPIISWQSVIDVYKQLK